MTFDPAAEATIETERLVLTPLVATDADRLFQPLQDQNLYRYVPQDPPASLVTLAERYRRLAMRQSPDGQETWLNWVVRWRKDLVPVGILQSTIYPNGTATIAYEVFPPLWGQGIAREGCTAMIDHLIRHWPLERLIAEIDTRNEPSIRLVESLGFVRVATVADADFFKGQTSHEYRYEWAVPAVEHRR